VYCPIEFGISASGNPYYKEVRSPGQVSVYGDDQMLVAEDEVMAEDVSDAVMADDAAIVADDAVETVAY
jgi:hypothetical protein